MNRRQVTDTNDGQRDRKTLRQRHLVNTYHESGAEKTPSVPFLFASRHGDVLCLPWQIILHSFRGRWKLWSDQLWGQTGHCGHERSSVGGFRLKMHVPFQWMRIFSQCVLHASFSAVFRHPLWLLVVAGDTWSHLSLLALRFVYKSIPFATFVSGGLGDFEQFARRKLQFHHQWCHLRGVASNHCCSTSSNVRY